LGVKLDVIVFARNMPDRMTQHTPEYLTTKEVAQLLRIKERRLYDLASAGEIPCTRALGKLLFQRSQIESWLARHGTAPATGPIFPRVVLGSHDPLLDWSLRESGSGLATFFDGSLDGLDRLAKHEGIAAGLHVYSPETDTWNRPIIMERFASEYVVLVEWAWRQRGLVVAPGNPLKIRQLRDLRGKRVVPRQEQAGSQLLLEHMLAQAGVDKSDLNLAHPVRSETDSALAVVDGTVDAAFGLLSIARQFRLDFVPVVRERFDLLVQRSEWFEEPFQRLVAFTQTDVFRSKIGSVEGYDFSGLWRVHFNARAPY
jgi:excisionase family DNA binding protein